MFSGVTAPMFTCVTSSMFSSVMSSEFLGTCLAFAVDEVTTSLEEIHGGHRLNSVQQKNIFFCFLLKINE